MGWCYCVLSSSFRWNRALDFWRWKISNFARTDIVFGMHGAGLTHSIFLPPGFYVLLSLCLCFFSWMFVFAFSMCGHHLDFHECFLSCLSWDYVWLTSCIISLHCHCMCLNRYSPSFCLQFSCDTLCNCLTTISLNSLYRKTVLTSCPR